MNQLYAVSHAVRFARRAGREIDREQSLAARALVLRLSASLAISLAISTGMAAQSSSPGTGDAAGSQSQGAGSLATGAPDHARQLAALKKACDTGALSQEECAQRMASLNAQPASQAAPQPGLQPGQMSSNDPNWNPNAVAPASSTAYRDGQGRYSLTIPEGWTATPAADGSGTLQLTRDSAWATVTLMTGAGSSASHPKNIAYAILHDMEPKYRDTAMIDENGFKYNGHSAYGAHAGGVDSKGAQVVVTVISVQISGLDFLSVVSSAPTDQARAINDQIMQMLHSIRFAGE
jgi:hypothetical protein